LRITLFFTYGVSLKIWAESGLLQREVYLYHELMRKYDIEVQFLTYGDTTDRQWESELKGITLLPVYERLPILRYKILSIFQSILIPWYFRKEFKKTNILKTNQVWGSWVAVLVKWIFNKPLLVRCGYEAYQNSLIARKEDTSPPIPILLVTPIIKYVSWLAYKCSNHIWLNTDEISEFVISQFHVSNRKITIQQNWIDTNLFKAKFKARRLTNRVLFVGRISEEKNLPLLINALSGTKIGLDIVGIGKLQNDVSQLATRLEVDIRFLGRVDNDLMPDIYNNYRIYVLCSLYEGNPKSLLEAMACGCAVIGTNVSGIRNVIQHDKTGVLVGDNAKSLRNVIYRLIDDEVFADMLSQSAERQIKHYNSIETVLRKEYEIYTRFLK